LVFFFFQAEDGIRDGHVTGVQTCALPIYAPETGIIAISGNAYSKGLSDRGDQFYIQAATNAQGVASFTWGTAARNFSGGITTTSDRKSTRLNSSHVAISYAVFCLKKKKQV